MSSSEGQQRVSLASKQISTWGFGNGAGPREGSQVPLGLFAQGRHSQGDKQLPLGFVIIGAPSISERRAGPCRTSPIACFLIPMV